MRSLTALSCISVLALTGCAIIVTPGDHDVRYTGLFAKDAVAGDGRLTTESRPVGTATELDMSGPLRVDVRVGERASLQVEADSNLLPLIRTEVAGDTLRVWVEGNVRTNNGMRVTYTVPQLAQVRASGSGRLMVAGLNGAPLTLIKTGSGDSQLDGRVGVLNVQSNGSGDVDASALQSGNANLNLNGSGSISVGQVNAEAINVKLRGSGDLKAAGKVTHLNAQLVGSGDIMLASLDSQRADLTVTGSGDISARVSQYLVAQAKGSGQITVYGNPEQRNVAGRNIRVVQ
jgi:hypothetical protein